MKSAPTATSSAPITPSAMPPSTNDPRRGTPRVAAQTTDMMSAASSTSRNTSRATAGIGSLHDQPALSRVAVEVAEESVGARVQGPHVDEDGVLRQHHRFTIEIGALELLGCGILVRHLEPKLGVGRNP